MKEPKFMLKVLRKQSVPVVEFSDMERIKSYQVALVDVLVYETKAGDETKRTKILHEIRTCEIWLKENFSQFINNNNREFGI